MWKNQGINVAPGTVITGKWHKQSYQIVKKLGAGAMGTVYLATDRGKSVAIKFGHNSSSITTEVNVLRTFKKVQDHHLGPSLLDVDDWVMRDGSQISFYAMEYMKGKGLNDFVEQHGVEWLGILANQLLDDLGRLHQLGWVFGDLKPDNLLVTSPPARLRWLDVGGTTQIGRAIKEYTEFYDRGYWGMGSRKADPQYDLFALAMVFIQIEYPSRFEKGTNPEKTLRTKLAHAPTLSRYHDVIQRAWQSEYASALEMKDAITTILLSEPVPKKRSDRVKMKRSNVNVSQNHANRARPTKSTAPIARSAHVWELIGIVMTVCLFYMMYVIMQWI